MCFLEQELTIRSRTKHPEVSRDDLITLGDQLKAMIWPKERSMAITFEVLGPDMDCVDGSIRVTLTPTDPKKEPVSAHAHHLPDALHMARKKLHG